MAIFLVRLDDFNSKLSHYNLRFIEHIAERYGLKCLKWPFRRLFGAACNINSSNKCNRNESKDLNELPGMGQMEE